MAPEAIPAPPFRMRYNFEISYKNPRSPFQKWIHGRTIRPARSVNFDFVRDGPHDLIMSQEPETQRYRHWNDLLSSGKKYPKVH